MMELQVCSNYSRTLNTLFILLSSISVKGEDYIDPGYTGGNRFFRYDSCQQKDCFGITIVNDIEVEDAETFTVTLEFNIGRGSVVKLEGNTAEITIINEDSMSSLNTTEDTNYL